MGKLIFEGDNKVLETISKSNRLRAKKYGLKVTLEGNSKPKEEPKEYEFAKTDYREVIKKVKDVDSLEDLKAFEADERKTVIEAVEDKKAELTA